MAKSGTRLRQYRETCDPFHTGTTGLDQLGTGYIVLGGMHFPLLSGAVILLRRRLYSVPGPWRVCGMARPDDADLEIKNYTGFDHEVSMGFHYTAVKTDGNGYVSEAIEPIRVDFDAAGDRITVGLPMWPQEVFAEAIADGEFRVSWTYDPWGQAAWPTGFEVYEGADQDNIDYGNKLGTVAFDPDAAFHTYETGAGFADGTEHAFAVRAFNGSPLEKNTYTTEVVTAIDVAPTAAEIQLTTARRTTLVRTET
jgi:hypothetical protein